MVCSPFSITHASPCPTSKKVTLISGESRLCVQIKKLLNSKQPSTERNRYLFGDTEASATIPTNKMIRENTPHPWNEIN